MELTKEYFDNALKSLATKTDLADLATSKDLSVMKVDLEAQIAELARMTQRGFKEVSERLNEVVRSKVEELQEQMHQVRQELNLA